MFFPFPKADCVSFRKVSIISAEDPCMVADAWLHILSGAVSTWFIDRCLKSHWCLSVAESLLLWDQALPLLAMLP